MIDNGDGKISDSGLMEVAGGGFSESRAESGGRAASDQDLRNGAPVSQVRLSPCRRLHTKSRPDVAGLERDKQRRQASTHFVRPGRARQASDCLSREELARRAPRDHRPVERRLRAELLSVELVLWRRHHHHNDRPAAERRSSPDLRQHQSIDETRLVTRDGRSLDAWCREVLGAGVVTQMFSSGHLAAVVGVELDDGRRLVLKIRPASPRLATVVSAQRYLHDRGVPCPRPLLGPAPYNGQAVTVESYVPAEPLPTERPPPDATAELLASVVAAAPAANTVTELGPAPPWVGWDHTGDEIWPPPDDLDVNLNQVSIGDEIDEAARRVRHLLRRHTGARAVGHVDWEAHNLGWSGQCPVVIYDWDSLAIRTEATIAGAAATVFGSTTGTTVAASLDETDAFLESYQQRRALLKSEDLKAAWAAGLWTLLYNAKKEAAGGGPGYLRHLHAELDDRMRRPGL